MTNMMPMPMLPPNQQPPDNKKKMVPKGPPKGIQKAAQNFIKNRKSSSKR